MNTRVRRSKSKSKEVIKKNESTSPPKKTGFLAKKYFGKLVRGLDGLEYQRATRYEWS